MEHRRMLFGVTGPLLALSAALAAVGIASRTPLRHLIQSTPIVVALAGASRAGTRPLVSRR